MYVGDVCLRCVYWGGYFAVWFQAKSKVSRFDYCVVLKVRVELKWMQWELVCESMLITIGG